MLARNYRCRLGEIDIVMCDGPEPVLVEVRYRGSEGSGGPGASVDQHKQRRLAAAAAHYLQRAGDDLPARFDVVAVHRGPRIEWIRNAFEVEQ